MTVDADAGDDSGDPFDAPALPVDDPDELAGVVDLFGALTHDEVTRALVELAYRQGSDAHESAVEAATEAAVAAAVERYYLIEYVPEETTDSDEAADATDATDEADETLLTVGPVSFPGLPAEAEDLPHILDYPTRSVSREWLARSVEGRLRGDAARAVAADDVDRVRHLLDVTYDLEAWAPVDVSEVRDRLDDALAESESESESA